MSRTAVITGGASGIGLGLAEALLRRGDAVVICGRSEQKLRQATERLSEICGERLRSVVADVSVEGDVETLFSAASEAFGIPDILVNNAGAFDGGAIEHLSLGSWDRVIGACLTGSFLCTREAFRLMKSRGRGRVLNIGSISAQRPRLNSAAYTAAKFGVEGLTQAAALEGRQWGISVGCLHPGNVLVERRLESGLAADDEPMMSVESIVRAALAMLDMPDGVNFLNAIVLPTEQLYVGRG